MAARQERWDQRAVHSRVWWFVTERDRTKGILELDEGESRGAGGTELMLGVTSWGIVIRASEGTSKRQMTAKEQRQWVRNEKQAPSTRENNVKSWTDTKDRREKSDRALFLLIHKQMGKITKKSMKTVNWKLKCPPNPQAGRGCSCREETLRAQWWDSKPNFWQPKPNSAERVLRYTGQWLGPGLRFN